MPEHVLLTGATGGLGSVILEKLIKQGDRVTASIRSLQKHKDLLEKRYASAVASNQLRVVEIPDMAVPGVFDEFAKDATAIMHVATAVSDDNFEELTIKPTWAFNENILKAAAASPSVKRVIITGSIVSTFSFFTEYLSGRTISEKDFNPIKREDALGDLFSAYCYSKVWSEQNSWDFMKKNSPHFDLIFHLVPTITGRSSQVGFVPRKDWIGGQVFVYKELFNAGEPDVQRGFHIYMDVDDIADIHVRSLSKDVPGNERYLFAAPDVLEMDRAADHIREVFPELRDRVPEGNPDAKVPEGIVKLDTSKADKVFGTQWKGFRESTVATVQSILDYEKVHGQAK